jgi:DNA-binding transcriptional LysR family regulator
MDRLESMSVIVAVAEADSVSAASRKLGRPIPTVSRKLSELEARLNTQLFRRSSRKMTLTDAGQAYIEACKRIIEQVDDAERRVSGEYRTPTGDLTVTAPWGLGHMHLLPIACEFLEAYPDITLRLLLSDRVLRPLEAEQRVCPVLPMSRHAAVFTGGTTKVTRDDHGPVSSPSSARG